MSTPETIYLKDYQPHPYKIESVELTFELAPSATRVKSELKITARDFKGAPLRLVGENLKLESIAIDGQPLAEADYVVDESGITISRTAAEFTLHTEVTIAPDQNSALEGLYISSNNFCTQCEAEGFRKITYYIDRPDNMAVFSTTIIASSDYPVLLSNGNCIETGQLDDGRHMARWHDPHPKPSYLFALVAGKLLKIADQFTTMSGRQVALEIYVESGNEDKCDHAMNSLKNAMKWDEEVYGREYDLDRYMIVAVNDFNMGAMENKGLNVFNSKYVLARPDTATDVDFEGIEGVIAHEYFHNWSGNRVTCRDWFQLSLKEGLTVFRDQQFSAAMHSEAVKRIDDVRLLRTHQFAEDAGPMAHPVRPESFVEINNFYTLTVYEKGAELIRMLHTILGAEGFRKGSDLYFERHDGQAVTCDDWVQALADANKTDLSWFMVWYRQAGTPRINVARDYDQATKRLTLTISQQLVDTPKQPAKHKLMQPIPIKLGLLDGNGNTQPVKVSAGDTGEVSRLIIVDKAEQQIELYDVAAGCVPSLLQNFSAPVQLDSDLTSTELAHLMAYDKDSFNRWDAGQKLAEKILLDRYHGRPDNVSGDFHSAYQKIIADSEIDAALKAEALNLPDILYLIEQVDDVDPLKLYNTVRDFERELVADNRAQLINIYQQNIDHSEYVFNTAAVAKRRLKNRALALLARLGEDDVFELCWQQYQAANNMTDSMSAFSHLVHQENRYRNEVLQHFYQRWQSEPLVLDKWFAIQATAPLDSALQEIIKLREHADFTLKNPNRVRSLIASFAMRNPVAFHQADGAGYQFLSKTIMALDAINPQVASRMVRPLTQWRHFDASRKVFMRAELEKMMQSKLSRDLYEIVSKSLGD
jgi:aminopeptidase N